MKKYIFKVIYVINIIIIFSYILYMINFKYNNSLLYKYKNIYDVESNYAITLKRQLYIPKINLSSDIVKLNDSMDNLDKNIAYYNSFNINNKIIIFGHSGVGKGVYFNRLDELSIDDIMYIYDSGYEYVYYVNDIYIIRDTDTFILKDEINSNKIILVTCDKSNKRKRLVVQFVKRSAKNLIKS